MNKKILAISAEFNPDNLYAHPSLKHTIHVTSNMDHNKGKIVKLAVKEISKITFEEAPILIDLLKKWMIEANGFAHESSIEAYIAILEGNPLPATEYCFAKVYFAISSPETNGTNQIELESFLEFEYHKNVKAVSCWENHPHNQDSDLARWRMLDGNTNSKPTLDTRKFLGVGRQLLWHAIQKEVETMDDKKDNLYFYIGALEVMKEEGVEIKEVDCGFRSEAFSKLSVEKLLIQASNRTITRYHSMLQP